ncbi:FG-GAP repeat protein [Streptomyces sp. NPDC050803]|uniref:FG-GAP repeat protein n=1 Tax=unclassified Streptomyces TaxID=2593676 RepID=UPI00343BAF74
MNRVRQAAVVGAVAVGAVTVALAGLRGFSSPDDSPAESRERVVDFDGDGHQDLASPVAGDVDGVRGAGYVSVVYGSATARKTRTQLISQNSPGVPGRAERGNSFGSSPAEGDLDGDGYTDLVVSAPGDYRGDNYDRTGLTVLWGGPRGLSGGTEIEVPSDTAGHTVTGDFDGDGHLDLATEGMVAYGPVTRRGGAERTAEFTLQTREHPVDEDDLEVWETFDVEAGDVNGDGRDDLLATAWVDYDGELVGTPFLLYLKGTPEGLAKPRTVTRSAGRDLRAGQELSTGDLDGDGFTDVLFGDIYDLKDGHVGLVRGGASGPDGTEVTSVGSRAPGVAEPGGRDLDFGLEHALGDVDGDGDLDVAVGSPRRLVDKREAPGRVVVLKGDGSGRLTGKGAQSVDLADCDVPATRTTEMRFARDVRLADLNGDDRAELLIAVHDVEEQLGYCVLPGTRGGPADSEPYFIEAPK